MPVNVGQLSARCNSCGWTKNVHTQGDVILDCPESCPRCGSLDIVVERPSRISGLADALFAGINKIFNSR